jgi:hypothetical protein
LRKRAAALGLEYEARPPYFILSTPSISRADMENVFERAEKALGVSFAPETRPLLKIGSAGRHVTACHPGTGAVYYMHFDIDDPIQNALLRRKKFEDTSNSTVLHIRCADPNPRAKMILSTVQRFIAANPFSSLHLLLQHNAGVALDIYDQLSEVLKELPSSYLERLYGKAPACKQRRLLACFPLNIQSRINRTWLDSLREMAGILWTAPCRTEKEALLTAGQRLSDVDYLYLDIPPEAVKDKQGFFAHLSNIARDPSGIVLPALELQWGLVRFQEKKG